MKNLLILSLLFSNFCLAQIPEDVPAHPYIKLETTEGDIILELDGRRAPITVHNFLTLVDDGYFDNTIFHRVIADFMIQGGGYTPSMNLKEEENFIANESGNGLANGRGTIAMARRSEPHTATAQFFINVNDNHALNPRPDRWGYTVFGNVIQGMEVADAISMVRTGPGGEFAQDVPIVPIVLKTASRYEFE